MTGSQPAVTVAMPTATVTALACSGARLYAFRAVRASAAACPLVWMVLPYSQHTALEHCTGLDAYTCPAPAEPGRPVRVGFTAPITTGQTLAVAPGGTGQVTQTGPASALAIRNDTEERFGCGLGTRTISGNGGATTSAMLSDATAAETRTAGLVTPLVPARPATLPYCHLPLNGQTLQILTPLDRILLMFATRIIDPGTPADSFYGPGTFSPGIVLDLAPAMARSVSYQIDHGWSWEQDTWARAVPAGTPLKEHLIENGPAKQHG